MKKVLEPRGLITACHFTFKRIAKILIRLIGIHCLNVPSLGARASLLVLSYLASLSIVTVSTIVFTRSPKG